jgi:hypothetical protein
VLAGYGTNTRLVDAREMIIFRDGLKEGFRARHLERVFGSVENLVHAAQEMHAAGTVRQVEALLCNPRVSGYSITQWNDVAWEFHAGLVHHWRTPKAAYFAMQHVHQSHHLVLKGNSSVAACGTTIEVALTLVNQMAWTDRAKIELDVLNPAGVIVASEVRNAPLGRGINECGTICVALEHKGEYRVLARLMWENDLIAQTTEHLLSLPPVAPQEISRQVEWIGTSPAGLDSGVMNERLGQVLFAAQPATLTANDWQTLLRTVEGGGAAVVGALQPRDEVALRALAERNIRVELHYGIGNWMPCYHWQPQSPLFEGLPADGLASQVYADILPWYVPLELGGEVLAGSFRNTQSRLEAPRMLWYSDVEVLTVGRGKLILCQYRLTDHIENPLAARMLCNLINVAQGDSRGE